MFIKVKAFNIRCVSSTSLCNGIKRKQSYKVNVVNSVKLPIK